MTSISPAPTFYVPSRDQMLRTAFSMPFSPLREFWEQAQQSAMTAPGIGTMIRGVITPPSNTPPKITSGMGPAADMFSAIINAPAVARDLAQNVIGRHPSMTPDEWKTSPYFRKEIPYDPGMTEERAAALAWQFDLGQARAFMSDKQAWVGPFGIKFPSAATFAGQFAGGLIDPVNYLPIFGPAARAAAVARFGARGLLRFGTELTIDAAEAAANVAVFSGLSAADRAKYGDDISWQAQINNVAMAALIGAVMHPIARAVGIGVHGSKVAATMAADRIAARNFKVGDVETARAVMNDVVASIVEKGAPEMSRPAQSVVDKLVQKAVVETQRDNALATETAGVRGDKAGEVVISPVGTRVNVRPEVVELSSLVQATGDLQGRDTSRLASDARAQEIAANYDPARAMPSIEGDRGAPIVGEDNVIDGGNHRVKALQIVYAAHPDKAEAYKAHLQAAGYNLDGFSQPVLIQRRTTPLTPESRAKFAAELNTSATARMSSSEQAAADRAALDDATLKQLAPGPVTSAENRAFVSRFLGNLPSAERTALIDKGGELNADGQRRIENALVAEAYGDVDATVLRRFSEATDDNTRSVVGAMADVAGNWSLLRRAMKRGDVAPEFDTTVELTTALRFLAGAREDAAAQKRPVSIVVKEGMAQLDMLGGGLSDEARAFVRMFYKTDEFKQSAGRDVIAARLQRVINAAEELGQPQLFDDAAAASKLGVIGHAINDEQGFLFTDDGARSSDGTVGESGRAAAAGADSGGSAQKTGAGGAADRSIADRMSERIVAAGRGGDEAKAIGNLVEAFYVKQAERLGLPVAEFERMFPLPEVRGPDGAAPNFLDPATLAQHGLDIYRAVGDAKVRFDDETQAQIFDVGQKLAEINKVEASSAAADEFPRSIKLGELRGEVERLRSEIGPYLDPGEPGARNAGDLARLAMLHWGDTTSSAAGKSGEVTALPLIYADQQRAWTQHVFAGLRAEAQAALAAGKKPRKAAAEADRQMALFQGTRVATDTPAFKAWFGESKVVDESGVPLVVYHGTDASHFEAFGGQPFFTSSENVAKTYGARVEPVYLSMKNPMILDAKGKAFDQFAPSAFIEKAKAAGHDGLIVHNIVDDATGTVKTPATDYLTFDPTQIKSVFNRGTFDPNDPRLLFQPGGAEPRGAISLLPEGTAPVLHILQNADASTAMHEMGHYFLHILKQIADKETAPFGIRRDMETLKEWWAANADEVAADAPHDGVTADDVKAVLRDGTSGDRVKDLAIDVALQEHWARGFEAYLRDGEAPSPGLRGVFEQFKAWLVDVYKRLTDLRVKLSPEVKGVMDRMLGAEDATATPASTTDANVQKAGNPAENVAQDPGQSALDFAAPPDPAPLPGIVEAEARLLTGPDDMAQLREQFGVDESGGFAEQGDIDLLEAQGLLSPDDKAALDAADVDIKNAESWGDALMTAARCAFRF